MLPITTAQTPGLLIPIQGGAIYTTPDQAQALFCCYAHSDADGVVQYIGHCKLMEVYAFPDARRNSQWPIVFAGKVLVINILAVSPVELETLNYRYNAIQAQRPHCNVNGFERQSLTAAVAIECIETGERFPTITAAAIAHGVSQSQLSNHLAGRKYFHRVQGRTYRRVTG